MLGNLTEEQMSAELGRVPEKAVSNWAKRCFGETVQWLRRKFMRDQPTDHDPEPNPG